MIHYGDITKIHGDQVPAVHVITGGSPCQDLSVAGKRAGLAGERSGLFMEQIRIVKEMRENDRRNYAGADNADRLIRPRFMVWENVPGAFSSNKGEDFRAVLEETAKVADKDAVIPGPPKGKWTSAGCIMGDGWSIAWRVHDAQFWGVPQRRKRIALVADFGGECAPEILFERESVSGNTEKSGKEGQEAAGDAGAGTGETGGAISFQERAGCPGGGKGILIQNERTGALSTLNNQPVCFEPGAMSRVGGHAYEDDVAGTVRANAGDNQQAVCLNSWDVQSKHIQPENGIAESLYAGECRGGGGESYVMQSKVYGISSYDSNGMKSDNPNSGIYEADTSRTLDLNGGNPACNQGGMAVVSMATKQLSQNIGDNVAMPICANDYKEPQVVCLEGNGSRPSHQGDGYAESETMYTLNSTEHHAVCVKNPSVVNVEMEVSVRKYEVDKNRLIECLHKHKTMPLQKIAEALNVPKTMVEHWFRKDSCFSVPDADIWLQLKTLLNIDTDEFDESIMTYEVKPGNYDTRNRIHMGDVAPTLNTQSENTVYCLENHPTDSRVKIANDGKVQTLSSRMETGGGNVPMVVEQKSLNGNDISDTLVSSLGNAVTGTTQDRLAIVTTYQKTTGSLCASGYNKLGTQDYGIDSYNQTASEEITESLRSADGGDSKPKVCYGLDRASYNQGANAKYDFSIEEEKIGPKTAVGPGAVCQPETYQKITGTVCARISAGTSNQLASDDMFVANTSIVRRLTPLECTRLQGFPDGWVDIGEWVDSKGKVRKDSDANKYKALGNSIALPFWQWMAERMMPYLPKNPTMASLFSGIGGFELVFARAGCKPIWNSEIESYPEAVTRVHFGDDERGIKGDYEKYL